MPTFNYSARDSAGSLVKGNLEAVTLLLDLGADPSVRVRDRTALDLARSAGHEAAAELLESRSAKTAK